MENLLPFPNFSAGDAVNRMKQMEQYLFQLRECLELALTDIGPANFSAAFRSELSGLGLQMQDMKLNAEERQQRVEQVSNGQLTVPDVLNSEAYKASVRAVKPEGGTGYVKFPDGTMICYGTETAETSITFHESYETLPVLVTSPSVTAGVTEGGFTVTEADGFSWIAIGRYHMEQGV